VTAKTQIRKQITSAIRDLEALDREVVAYTNDGLDLVGTAEAAEILGITSNALASRVKRGSMPAPIVTLRCGPIWHRETIEAMR
jgi:DNA-directed RNA polymerase specialized sigma24 family protein